MFNLIHKYYTNTHKIFSLGEKGIIKFKFKLNEKELNDLNKNSLKKNNNIVILIKQNGDRIEYADIPGISISFLGKNSKVEIYESKNPFFNCKFYLNNNCNVCIRETNESITNLNIYCMYSNDVSVNIEKNCSINSANIEMNHVNNLVFKLGADCMVSGGIIFRLHDAHTIFDLTTKQVLNKPLKGIIVGEHCWIAQNVTILKDVELAPDTIVGFGSIVTKSFHRPNTIIAGTPAKIVKENVNWTRQNVFEYESVK